jgi:hypothetical protein
VSKNSKRGLKNSVRMIDLRWIERG